MAVPEIITEHVYTYGIEQLQNRLVPGNQVWTVPNREVSEDKINI